MMLLTFTLLTTNYTVKHFAVVFFVVWRVTIISNLSKGNHVTMAVTNIAI